MIEKTFKCKSCGVTEEVNIETADITGNKGLLDQEILTQRIENAYDCPVCGSRRVQKYTIPTSYFFEMGIGKGKISQRFK